MSTYTLLDAIADSVNWVLLAVMLSLIAADVIRSRWSRMWRSLAALIGIIVIVYGMGCVDRQLGLWSNFNSDYSTHTAAALALILLLMNRFERLWPMRWSWPLIGIAYALLMRHQGYHDALDIISTAVPVGVLVWVWLKVVKPCGARGGRSQQLPQQSG